MIIGQSAEFARNASIAPQFIVATRGNTISDQPMILLVDNLSRRFKFIADAPFCGATALYP